MNINDIEQKIQNNSEYYLADIFQKLIQNSFFDKAFNRTYNLLFYSSTQSIQSALVHIMYSFIEGNLSIKELILKKINSHTLPRKLIEIFCSNIVDLYKKDIIEQLNKKLSIVAINNEYKFIMDTNKIKKIYTALYLEIKQYIRNNIKKIYNATDDHVSEEFHIKLLCDLKDKKWNTLSSLSPTEADFMIQKVYDDIESYFENYIKNRTDLTLNDKLFFDLGEYLNQNLRKIFLNFDLQKDDENNIYYHSWTDDDDGTESQYLIDYLIDNKNEILQEMNYTDVTDELWHKIIHSYIYMKYVDLTNKIRSYIGVKNDGVRNSRANDLLALNDDDKIGIRNSTSIDYDITNDYVRTRPLIIINDENTDKDYVFFGPKGSAHSTYVENKLQDDMRIKNVTPNKYKIGYGYLLGSSIAFVDEQGDNFQVGYTLEDEVNILKNDPRIKKVYTTPGKGKLGGPITRLAKLIFYK